jgi:hypothetical protein
MERLSNSVSTVIQLWKPIKIRTTADGDGTFSETSVRTSATRYKALEIICYNEVEMWYLRSSCYLHKAINRLLRFEIFTAVTMKNGVFWDVTPCGSCKKGRFGGT